MTSLTNIQIAQMEKTINGHWLDLLITKRISNSNKTVFRQQVFQTILQSYQKLPVVRRNGTSKKYRSEK